MAWATRRGHPPIVACVRPPSSRCIPRRSHSSAGSWNDSGWSREFGGPRAPGRRQRDRSAAPTPRGQHTVRRSRAPGPGGRVTRAPRPVGRGQVDAAATAGGTRTARRRSPADGLTLRGWRQRALVRGRLPEAPALPVAVGARERRPGRQVPRTARPCGHLVRRRAARALRDLGPGRRPARPDFGWTGPAGRGGPRRGNASGDPSARRAVQRTGPRDTRGLPALAGRCSGVRRVGRALSGREEP